MSLKQQYSITLNYLKAPQVKEFTMNGVKSRLPISKDIFLKAIKAKSPYLSFIKVLETNELPLKDREVISIQVSSYRDLTNIELEIVGANAHFFKFEVKVEQ